MQTLERRSFFVLIDIAVPHWDIGVSHFGIAVSYFDIDWCISYFDILKLSTQTNCEIFIVKSSEVTVSDTISAEIISRCLSVVFICLSGFDCLSESWDSSEICNLLQVGDFN